MVKTSGQYAFLSNRVNPKLVSVNQKELKKESIEVDKVKERLKLTLGKFFCFYH